MKKVKIELKELSLYCTIMLNQEDNIDQGFELIKVKLIDNETDIKSIIDEKAVCDLIHEEIVRLETMKSIILSEYGKGKIAYASPEGISSCPVEDFLSQPLEGILYDLNRDEVTILTFIEDRKWINDFAMTKVLKYLYSKLEKYEKEASTISEKDS